METNPARGVALPDNEYDRIVEILQSKHYISLKNKDGVEKKFYKKDGSIYAESWIDNDKVIEEVFKLSTVSQQYANTFRESVRQRMIRDHPEWSAEQVEASADIIDEANETIKRLMSAGIDYTVAVGVVKHTLTSSNIDEEVKDIEKLLAASG
jgi:hypothetical protein